MERSAQAIWRGPLKEGRGILTTASDALHEVPYAYRTRFEEAPGTNPEELIAAAHAGCFSMALSAELQKMRLIPESIETRASARFEQSPEGWTITRIHLDVLASVPGAAQDKFLKAADAARTGCPVSRVLKSQITMNAVLKAEQASA